MLRFEVLPAEKTYFRTNADGLNAPISPDGRRIAFSASGTDGRVQLWVRSLDTQWAQPLAGTDNGVPAFWSPDSRMIAFGADGKLKKIDATGGPAITLADAPAVRGGTWNDEGIIVFAPTNLNGSTLLRISSGGGAAVSATKLNGEEVRHRFPWFLPDGRHFLFEASPPAGGQVAVRVGSLDSVESQALLNANSNAIYAQGHLLFLRGRTLMAQPFDLKRLSLSGEAAPVAEHVQAAFGATFTLGLFSVSSNGMLAYHSGADAATNQLAWLDRGGKRLSTVGEPSALATMRLLPTERVPLALSRATIRTFGFTI